MEPIELAQEIADYLQEVNKIYDSEEKNITVVTGFIPDCLTNKDKKAMCPRIIVRPTEMTDSVQDLAGDMAEIKILITFLTYAEIDDDAYRLIYNWISKNRRELLKKRYFGDANLILPMTTKVLDEDAQPKPMWGGYILATYRTQSIEEEGLLKDEYGYEV